MDYRGSAFAEIWAPSSLQNPSMERCVWFSFTQCGDRLPDMAGRCASTRAPPSLRYSSHVREATNFRGAEKSRVWLGGDILWPDGETEVVKGFITEHDAFKWIAEHSQANVPVSRYRQGSSSR